MASALWMTSLMMIFGFVVTALTVPYAREASFRLGLVCKPGGRRRHTRPTPVLGGLAIYLPVAVVFPALIWAGWSGALTMDKVGAAKMVSLFLGSTWLLILGIMDDKRTMPWWKKLPGQTLGALILVMGGHTLATATVPVVGPVDFGWLGGPMLAIAVICVTNAVNLIDGLDGLAGGICFFAALTCAVIALAKSDVFSATLAFTVSGALLGFLLYNFPPASIFMGDGGSMMVGFILATLATSSMAMRPGQRLGTSVMIMAPLLPFGIPLFEVGLSIVRRWVKGQAIFLGDGNHLHHRLIARIQNPRLTVGIFYFFSAALCALTIMSVLRIDSPFIRLVGAWLVVLLCAGAIASIRMYRVDSLWLTLKNRRHFKFLGGFLGFMKQRMARAETLDELVALLETGVRDLAFDSVEVSKDGESMGRWVISRQLHPGNPRMHSERTFEECRLTVRWVRPIHDDEIYNEYLMLTWHRFMMAFQEELCNHVWRPSPGKERNGVEFARKSPE